jgi:nucleotide-binding universal stress UspA family protein
MATYHRIVHPTDFSEASAEALPYALDLARRHDAELILLHVFVLPDVGETIDLDEITERERSARRQRLDQLLEIVRKSRPATTAELIEGVSAANTILDHALHQSMSLIVMGTQGWGLEKRADSAGDAIGSTAEKVVRLAPCSVLTVRPGVRRCPSALSRILVPVDFSPHSRLALSVARELARVSGAVLTVLHVIEPVVRPVFYGRGRVGLELDGARLEARAREEVDRLISRIGRTHVSTRALVRRGRPDSEIVSMALEEDSQLIVQGSRGLSGLNYLLLGSVAERVVRSSPCPVLTVKGKRELQKRRLVGHHNADRHSL